MSGCALHGEAFTSGCPGCLDYADDLAIARIVRRRMETDTGERITLDELLAQLGLSREDFPILFSITKSGEMPSERAVAVTDAALAALAELEVERDEVIATYATAAVEMNSDARRQAEAAESRARAAEASLAGLKAERDALTTEAESLREQLYTDERVYERMRAAEAALDELEAKRDAAIRNGDARWRIRVNAWIERAVAAEASLVAHREALRHLAHQIIAFSEQAPDADDAEIWLEGITREARAALAVVGREEERQDLGGDQRSPVAETGRDA